jgi:DnaJ-class molecular chaperone
MATVMSDNPYDILGVKKTATEKEIKAAYRKLAKSLHPDLHPGDPGKQAEFQAVAAAYDLLGDAEKRRRFDAGEIDASGQERHDRRYYHEYAAQDAGQRYDSGSGFGGFEDVSDIFADLFGQRSQGRGNYDRPYASRGADVRYHLEVDFLDAARGSKRAVTMPDGQSIEISIPAGIRDGQTIRLRGKGAPGDGSSGDALVTVAVKPHSLFSRNGNDIEMELPITFDEAVLGAKVDVPTVSGNVSMTIPKGATSGQRLRLKGRGIANGKSAGDQVVRLKIALPRKIDREMEQLAERWREHSKFDPRADLRRGT